MNTKMVSMQKSAVNGALAGLAGGVIFGIMMATMGMLPMVAMLVGQESVVVGFIVHMLISAFIGTVYGVIVIRFPNQVSTALLGGIINGIAWWVLGALILMPLMLGMTAMVFVIGEAQWMSLLGHLIYGLITGFTFFLLVKRA